MTRGRRDALERALRDAIHDGRLARGTVLPSSRALAGDLHLSRGTVVDAYAQLVAEGGHDDLRVLIVGGDLESNTADSPELRRLQALTAQLGLTEGALKVAVQPATAPAHR